MRINDKEHGQLAPLTQTRDTLVKLRTALKNKINNILSARGLNLTKEALSSEKKLAEVLELPFDEIVQIELRVIVEQIRSLNRSIAELEKAIAEEGWKLDGHKNLVSTKGIGKITSAILLSAVGDVNDFADEGHLARYFGIVPRVSNSNETEHSGRIHNRGTKLGRTALVQSALIAAKYSPYLKRFYEQIKARRGPARRSSRWPGSFWTSSTGRSRTGGCSKTYQTLSLPRAHEKPLLGGPPPGIQMKRSLQWTKHHRSIQ